MILCLFLPLQVGDMRGSSGAGGNLHIEAVRVDHIISRVKLTKCWGTRTCFARMIEKAIMTKQRLKTHIRPTFCFIVICFTL